MIKSRKIVISVITIIVIIAASLGTFFIVKYENSFIRKLERSGVSVSAPTNPMAKVEGWDKYREYALSLPNVSKDLLEGKDERKPLYKYANINAPDFYKNMLAQTMEEEMSSVSYYDVQTYAKNIFILRDKRNSNSSTTLYKDYIVCFQPEDGFMHICILKSSPSFTNIAIGLLKPTLDALKIE
jgi:hypothetical protein